MINGGISKTRDEALRKKELYARIPVWNRLEERVITGEEAPTRRNLIRYLTIYSFCDLYVGQDRSGRQRSIDRIYQSMGLDPNERVVMWNTQTEQIIRGTKSPRRGEIAHWLKQNPDCVEFVPWETRVTKRVLAARKRWLLKVRGTSYLPGRIVLPTIDDEDEVIDTIDLTTKPFNPTC